MPEKKTATRKPAATKKTVAKRTTTAKTSTTAKSTAPTAMTKAAAPPPAPAPEQPVRGEVCPRCGTSKFGPEQRIRAEGSRTVRYTILVCERGHTFAHPVTRSG